MSVPPTLRRGASAVGLAAVLALGLVPAAYAQGTEEQQQACTPDAVKLCSDTIPDIPKTTACMKAHFSQLSPRCQTAFGEATGAPKTKTAARPTSRAAGREVEPRARTSRRMPERLAPPMHPHREAALPPQDVAPAPLTETSPPQVPGYPPFPASDAPLVQAPPVSSPRSHIADACRAGLIDSFTCSTTVPALLGGGL